MTPHRLWIARHAPVLQPPGTCYGQLDAPADPVVSAASAQRLAERLPRGISARHSPLQRCALLAHQLQALRPDITIAPDERLIEMDFGCWEGLAWAAIARTEIDAWSTRFANHRPGGGDSLAQVLERVNAALQEVREQPGDALWISHAGVARCVQWLLGDQGQQGQYPTAAQWPQQAPAPGQWACYALI
jgi:alpha-ribazole phosphatase